MRCKGLGVIGALALAAVALGGPARAEFDPIFDFIPLGGRSLLAEVLAAKPPADEVRALLTGQRSAEKWLGYLKDRTAALSGLQGLADEELATLADYLAVNMPLPPDRVPADPARANWPKVLPRDGRDLALEYCQSCHIITVTVTQDRTVEHWLGTMNKPSHIEIKLSAKEREALARYLVLNAGIPIDLIPEDLRAGGASY
ncbi:MAG: hypothetical protein SCH98_16175 [Deferrisomatales bacterium]|nr:hypothetical protein [Deferrisomatales bacterium]